MTKYRVSRYGYKAYQIEKWHEKKDGTGHWVAYKYPGGLVATANGLLDEGMEYSPMYDTQEIVECVESAQAAVLAALESAVAKSGMLELEF
jgi:hypothetical protein